MKIGNLPKPGSTGEEGKVYWQIASGRDSVPGRFFDGGWRAFEFVVFKPYREHGRKEGGALPFRFRFAFAYWLPFYPL